MLWLRLLTLSMGHTTAAVGTVLAAFMGGLALGAWLGGRVASSLAPHRALRTYAWLELTIAACALLLPLASASLRPVLVWAYANGDGGLLFAATRVALALLLIVLPTIAMGATYPMAVRWFAVDDPQSAVSEEPSGNQKLLQRSRPLPTAPRPLPTSIAAHASRVYAANTAGAALGVVLGGFVLLAAARHARRNPRRRGAERLRRCGRNVHRTENGRRRLHHHEPQSRRGTEINSQLPI